MDFDDRPDFAKRLEEARIARGFDTAKAAAAFFGWSYNTYAQHENGTRGIGRAAAKYAKAYRASEGWLLTGEGQGPGEERIVPIVGKAGPVEVVKTEVDTEAQLRAALLAFGVDRKFLARAVATIRAGFVKAEATQEQTPPDGQSQPANPRREVTP